MPPIYIAARLGHSIEQLFGAYTKLLEGSDGGAARRLMDGALDTVNAQHIPKRGIEMPSLPMKIHGRRDWTRTNDPHHVKVVL